MKLSFRFILAFIALSFINSCSTGKDIVRVIEVTGGINKDLSKKELAKLEAIRAAKKNENNGHKLNNVIKGTQNYSVTQYLAAYPNADNPVALDYRVGGYDILDIKVYEEPDLSRTGVRISADGNISFPLIGRILVNGLTTSEIETLISDKLARGQFIIDAHVSVIVSGYWSKQFMVLGPVAKPGSFPLKARERVLDAISKAEGIESEQGGNQLMIIRTQHPDTQYETKIVIRIDLAALLHEGDQQSNLLLMDRDLLYIPRARQFYLIGQVKKPGSFFYRDKDITLVEAISMAGGFTKIAARNRTRIVRMEDGIEKIIVVKIDAITKSGKKGQDILIHPGDIIVVPESFF
ncbi:MAG: polysaccharide biosynthesis/export protein [Desulfobacteraceae bacterium Eth-SRB2]|nr:MAG: polysaccharide biosynthesis/export protein [Desulfobacteraceae bacterium Eth-SRB2]